MALLLGFGKKRKSTKKPPTKLLKLCKKLKIKVTIKRGNKRVYKKTTLLKKLCKKRSTKSTKSTKKSKFGNTRDQQNKKKVSQFGFFWPFTNSMTREERRRARELKEGTRLKIRANTPRFGGFPWPFKSDKEFLEELRAKYPEYDRIREIRKNRDKRIQEEKLMKYPGEVY
jgi:hypothetical protein